jgi:hypothetical protein
MYNHNLNEMWRKRLVDAVAGKRVVMVGNATSIFSKKYGELIDNYDFVVRFGKGVPYPEYREYLGTRTDLWFFGSARAGMYPKFDNAMFKMYTLAQMPLYKKKAELAYPREMADGKFQVYSDFFLAGTAAETLACNEEINPNNPDARISQGAQCVHYFANFVQSYGSIDLIGFDFFGSGFVYNYETGKNHIPVNQPTTSWHCPLQSKNFDENPHNQDGNEERYIRSVPRLTVHQMPPVDLKKMEEVLLKLRGKNATITGETL